MEVWYVFLVVVTFVILFPYIRCFFKRLNCVRKIKKICRRKEYKIHTTHPLWFLGNKHSKKCDLYIETVNEVFAIKLFGMPRRRTVLVFKGNGEYFIRSFIAFAPYGSAIRYPIDSKPKLLSLFDFRYKYKHSWEIKTPRRILLVNPVPMEFRRQLRHGGEVIVGAGDIVNGMEIDSLPRLLGDLESAI